MEKVKATPDAYIESLPVEVRPSIEKLDKEISKIFNDGSRVLWTGKFWAAVSRTSSATVT